MRNSTKRSACVAFPAALLLAAASARAAAVDPQAFVGLKYPPLPETVVKIESFLTQEADDYAVSFVRVGIQRVLWLERFRGAGEAREYDVRAALSLPLLKRGQALVTTDCELAGEANPDIVAIGSWDGDGKLVEVTHAWRPNVKDERFEALPTDQVSCGAGTVATSGQQDSRENQNPPDSEETR